MIDSTQDTRWHADFKSGTSWTALNISSWIASTPAIYCLPSSVNLGMLSRMYLWRSMAIRLWRKLGMDYPWWPRAREPVWSPNWERPYRIKRCAPGNTYILETPRGEEEFDRAIKWGIFKEYYPNVWINTWQPICSAVSSNSRYQKRIASSVKINLEG